MRRLSTLWLAMTWLVAGMPHALAGHPAAIPARAALKSITLTDPSAGREVLLKVDGEYSFKTARAPDGALYVDLVGAELGGASLSARWANGPLAGYQLTEFTDSGGGPVLRVEFQTRGAEPLIAERENSGLRLRLETNAPTPNASAHNTPVLSTLTPSASARSTTVSSTIARSVPAPGTTAVSAPATPVKEAEPAPTKMPVPVRMGSVLDVLIRPGSAGEVH